MKLRMLYYDKVWFGGLMTTLDPFDSNNSYPINEHHYAHWEKGPSKETSDAVNYIRSKL